MSGCRGRCFARAETRRVSPATSIRLVSFKPLDVVDRGAQCSDGFKESDSVQSNCLAYPDLQAPMQGGRNNRSQVVYER